MRTFGAWAAEDAWMEANPDMRVYVWAIPPHAVHFLDPMRDGWECADGCCFISRLDVVAAKALRRPLGVPA